MKRGMRDFLELVFSLEDSFPLRTIRAFMPDSLRSWLRSKLGQNIRSVEPACFGNLRRLQPVSPGFGYRRGSLPIDRYYIEQFLSRNASDIRGHVLEIGDDTYTRKFGANRVTKSDVLCLAESNQKATIVADLTCAEHISSDTLECIILTQTLQFIYDIRAAVKGLYRILTPGGILLASMSGISKISRYDMDRWGEYWRFTSLSARRVFGESFPSENLEVRAFGNVLAAVAFLHGLAAEELTEHELSYHDPDYEVIITVRARKPDA